MAKQYNAYTGKWEDVYAPAPTSDTPPKATPNTSPTTNTTPPKPTTADKGNAHQGSGQDNKEDAEEKLREIEYDLEGTAEIHPDPSFSSKISARNVVVFEGMGNNFSGKYFLDTVVHTINRSGYKMSFDVLRNNFVWVSSTANKTPTNDVNLQQVQPKQEPVKKQQTYTVKKGDTLWAIAKRFYGDGKEFTRIVDANKGKIKEPDLIYPNQVFVIP